MLKRARREQAKQLNSNKVEVSASARILQLVHALSVVHMDMVVPRMLRGSTEVCAGSVFCYQ